MTHLCHSAAECHNLHCAFEIKNCVRPHGIIQEVKTLTFYLACYMIRFHKKKTSTERKAKKKIREISSPVLKGI